MKRYYLFAGANNRPAGGMDDFQGDFDRRNEARNYALIYKNIFDWYHIWDNEVRAKVEVGEITGVEKIK